MSETVSERSSKLYQILTGKALKRDKYRLFDWEPLLDSFLAFFDVCCTLESQKKDKQVANFVKKFKSSIDEIRSLRPIREDFELIKAIGRGHFGEVYVVKEKGTNDVYAMKILKKAATLSNDNIAFYEEERDIMAFAGSPWVTSLQYAFQDTENLYLVMEFLPGGDLLNLLTRYPDGIMEEDDARFYLCEIIMAVHAVHLIGYVHRDVKPENILLDMTGHVKLADFGSAAKLVNGKSVLCKMPVGTPEYIAPEVLQSMNSGGGIYGCECDWWSVGVVCYEMLCGCLPFEADGVLQLYSQIMNFKNTLVFPEDVEISESARSLIVKLLEDQKKRMQYNEIAQHEFFKSTDWTTLKNVNPPYIPQLRDSIDTSHFSDIRESRINAGRSVEPTLGNTMPFIGFTFTRNISNVKTENLKSKMSLSQSQTIDESEKNKDILRLSQQNEQLSANIENLTKNVSEMEKKCKKLENELVIAMEDCKTKAAAIKDLNGVIEKLTDKSNEVAANPQVIEELQNKITSLSSLLEEEKQNIVNLSNEREILKTKMNTLLGELEVANKKLRDSETSMKEFEKMQQKTQNELKSSLKELQAFLDKSTNEYEEKLKESRQELKSYRDLSEQLTKKLSTAEECLNNNTDPKAQLSPVSHHNAVCESCEDLKTKYHNLEDVLKAKESDAKAAEINIVRLNQNIRTYEAQIEQNEAKINEISTLIAEYQINLEKARSCIDNLTSEIIQSKSVVEQKDKKLSELQEIVVKIESTLQDERVKNADRQNKFQRDIQDLSASLSAKNNEMLSLKTQILELEKANANRNYDSSRWTEEIKRLTSVITAQKVSNFAMSQELEEAQMRINNLEAENEEIQSNIVRINASHKEHIYKLDATIAQQNKLINFLHAESSKKKGKSSKMEGDRGAKDSILPHAVSIRKARDVEQQLELERMQSLKLNNELNQAKEEIRHLKAELKKYTNSSTLPIEHASRFYVSETSIAGSINESTDFTCPKKEHNLCSFPCFVPNVCFLCLNPISFARPIVQCSLCKLYAHSECQSDFPTSACCPVKELLNVILLFDCSSLSKVYPDIDGPIPKLPYVGYLSVPNQVGHNKYDWHKRRFELTQTSLSITDDSLENAPVIGSIRFSDMSQPPLVRPAVHTSDIHFTPLANAPYVFGLELPFTEIAHFDLQMNSINQDISSSNNSTMLFMLAESKEDKRMWVSLFSEIAAFNRPCTLKTLGEPIYTFATSQINNINSIVPLSEENVLISYDQGILLLHVPDKAITRCFEEKLKCCDLCFVSNSLYALCGDSKQLTKFKREKSKSVLSISIKRPQLLFHPFQDYRDCLAILHSDHRGDVAYLFVVKGTDLLCIKVANENHISTFAKISINDCMPSSLIYIDNNVFYCQDKFYVYDTAKSARKEFLDSSDHSLAFVIYGSSNQSNYPMNMFRMSRTSERVEILVCCSEFGLVVDQEGRRLSTGDIRWDQIPLSFRYFDDVLLVCYPKKIELRSFKIDSLDNLNQSTVPIYQSISCPLMLGMYNCYNSLAYVSSVNINDYSLQLYTVSTKLPRMSRSKSATTKNDESKISSEDHSSSKATRRVTTIFNRKKK